MTRKAQTARPPKKRRIKADRYYSARVCMLEVQNYLGLMINKTSEALRWAKRENETWPDTDFRCRAWDLYWEFEAMTSLLETALGEVSLEYSAHAVHGGPKQSMTPPRHRLSAAKLMAETLQGFAERCRRGLGRMHASDLERAKVIELLEDASATLDELAEGKLAAAIAEEKTKAIEIGEAFDWFTHLPQQRKAHFIACLSASSYFESKEGLAALAANGLELDVQGDSLRLKAAARATTNGTCAGTPGSTAAPGASKRHKYPFETRKVCLPREIWQLLEAQFPKDVGRKYRDRLGMNLALGMGVWLALVKSCNFKTSQSKKLLDEYWGWLGTLTAAEEKRQDVLESKAFLRAIGFTDEEIEGDGNATQ